jgi:hypothetical protein
MNSEFLQYQAEQTEQAVRAVEVSNMDISDMFDVAAMQGAPGAVAGVALDVVESLQLIDDVSQPPTAVAVQETEAHRFDSAISSRSWLCGRLTIPSRRSRARLLRDLASANGGSRVVVELISWTDLSDYIKLFSDMNAMTFYENGKPYPPDTTLEKFVGWWNRSCSG